MINLSTSLTLVIVASSLNFKEIGHLSKLDQNKISDFTLDLKSKRRSKLFLCSVGYARKLYFDKQKRQES